MSEKENKKDQPNGTENPTEPSEHQPCIENGQQSEKKHDKAQWEIIADRLCKKSGLSRKGLYIALSVLVFLLVLLITVIVLAVCWPLTPHHQQFPVCDNSSCLRASAQVRINYEYFKFGLDHSM